MINYDSAIPSAIPYIRKGVIPHLLIVNDPKDVDFESPDPKHFALSGDMRMPTRVRDKIYMLHDRWVLIALKTD